MQIESSSSKAFLYNILAFDSGKERHFPLSDLADAASAAKKLLDGAERGDGTIRFVNKDVSFSAEEWILLKNLFKDVKTASVRDADTISELKEKFELLG